MKKYNTFLVDADDTVLDFHGSSLAALKAAFKAFKKEWSEEYGTEFFAFNDMLWQKLERKELTRERLVAERFPAYLDRLGVDDVPGEEFNEKYLSYLAKHPLYLTGAEEFLSALRKAGRIYIVTNGSEKIQKSRFRIAKLETYAEAVFISETIGCDKPGKAYNDYVIAHIPGFDRARTVWIGDSLTADVKAANEAGIDCIWFNPHDKSTDGKAFPDYEADCYREILEILQID